MCDYFIYQKYTAVDFERHHPFINSTIFKLDSKLSHSMIIESMKLLLPHLTFLISVLGMFHYLITHAGSVSPFCQTEAIALAVVCSSASSLGIHTHFPHLQLKQLQHSNNRQWDWVIV